MGRLTKIVSALLLFTTGILSILIVLVDTNTLLSKFGLKADDLFYRTGTEKDGFLDYVIDISEAKIHVFIALAILFVIFLYIFVKPERFVHNVKRSFVYLKEYVIDTYKAIRYSKVRFLLILPLVSVLYWCYASPVTYDESWTYILFVKTGVLDAIMLYPAPNNHVFHSFLANVTDSIPFLDILFKLRLPAAFFYLLSLVVVYRFVRKFYSENTAIFMVALYSMVSVAIRFGFCARGYSLVSFFFILSLFAAFCIIKDGSKKRHWVVFALSGILGAYTMPSFLYPFVTVNLLILIYNYKNIKQQIFYNASVGIFTFLLYLPVLIFNGVESISNNPYVTPTDSRLEILTELPRYSLNLLVNLFNGLPIILLPILLIPFINTIRRRDKDTLILWVLFGIMPAILLIAHSILPFFRTFAYYGFALTFLVVISLREYIDKLKVKQLFILSLVVQVLMFERFYQILDSLNIESHGYKALEKTIEDNKSYCVVHGKSLSFIHPDLLFERERSGYNMEIEMSYMENPNADSITQYDYLFVQALVDSTKFRKPTFTFVGPYQRIVNVYKKEDSNSIK